MEFESELQVRQQLAAYLSNQCSLKDFEDWFVPRSWNFHKNINLSLQTLVSSIELALAEFTNGDWNEQELRGIFDLLLKTYELDYDPLNPERQQSFSVTTGSDSSVLESLLTYSWTPDDIRFSAEYV